MFWRSGCVCLAALAFNISGCYGSDEQKPINTDHCDNQSCKMCLSAVKECPSSCLVCGNRLYKRVEKQWEGGEGKKINKADFVNQVMKKIKIRAKKSKNKKDEAGERREGEKEGVGNLQKGAEKEG